MLTITGEVRKILDDQYKDSKGNTVTQAILILEPANERKNYEIYLSATQVRSGAKDAWLKLQGQIACVAVSLFVNHEYKMHKFNATHDGKPLVPDKRQLK